MDHDAIRFVDVDPSLVEALDRPDSAFLEVIDLQLTVVSPDRVEAHLRADARLHQPAGILHGGVHATIVETVCSIGGQVHTAAEGRQVVGVSNRTDFLRPVRSGPLDVVAEPVHVGRRLHLWRASITREDGKLVAQGQVRLAVVDPSGLGG